MSRSVCGNFVHDSFVVVILRTDLRSVFFVLKIIEKKSLKKSTLLFFLL